MAVRIVGAADLKLATVRFCLGRLAAQKAHRAQGSETCIDVEKWIEMDMLRLPAEEVQSDRAWLR